MDNKEIIRRVAEALNRREIAVLQVWKVVEGSMPDDRHLTEPYNMTTETFLQWLGASLEEE